MNASKNPKLDELAKALTSASAEDLNKLKAKINGLLELGGGEKSKPTTATDWLFEGIVEELVSRGLLHPKAAASLQRSKQFKSYSEKAGPVRALLLKAAPGMDTSQTVLRAFGRRVAYCLAESLSGWTVVTPSLMLARVGDVPAAVDECYPGYLSCGLLGKLVKVAQTA